MDKISSRSGTRMAQTFVRLAENYSNCMKSFQNAGAFSDEGRIRHPRKTSDRIEHLMKPIATRSTINSCKRIHAAQLKNATVI